ncbi:MAG: hypothetical protein KIT83_04875 [Bryobacterales bacterium]|nr:hypothetical protein [Bryobacterales bacterium]
MAHDWITQKLISAATGNRTLYDNSKEYEFGWWFAYFWKEVGTKGRDEATLKEVLSIVFQSKFPADIAAKSYGDKRKEGDRVAAEFKALLPEPADLGARPAHYRSLLQKVLSLGFREITNTAITRPNEAQVKGFFADRIEADKNKSLIPMAIAYRGDTREFATVIAHKGAQSRVDLKMLNMDKPWHPFSDPVVAGKMYTRGASGDNCLYSVTSVATDVSIPVGFPLIEDQNIYSLPLLPSTETVRNLSKWNYKLFREAQAKLPVRLAKVQMNGVPGKSTGIFLATDSFIYAVRVKRAAHTQDFVETQFGIPQNQCKERGVRDVKLKNFLAGARIRRIHLGPARMCGTVGFVQEAKFFVGGRWVDNPDANAFANEHFYGDLAASNKALQMIRKQLQLDAGRIIQGESDDMAPNPMPVVSAIQQWNLTFEQFNAYKSQAPANLYLGNVS